jgi:hypothetical protein
VHTNHQQSQGQTVELHCVFRAQEASNDLTFYGIGDDALAALNKQLINFKYASTTQCLRHLHNEKIKMTMSQRDTRPKS